MNAIEHKTEKPVYSATLDFEKVEDGLVTFSSRDDSLTYPDGSAVEGHLTFNEHVWKVAGSPDKIVVAFSAAEFFCIGSAAYERLRERFAS